MTRALILVGFQFGTQWLSAGVEVIAPDESAAVWFDAGLAERVAEADEPADASVSTPAPARRKKGDT